METISNNANHANQAATQQPLKMRRSSRADQKPQEEEVKEVHHVKQLIAHGWRPKDDVSANTVFLFGPVVVCGRLHATDKLCLRGVFYIVGGVWCEGNFTLYGTVTSWYVRCSLLHFIDRFE